MTFVADKRFINKRIIIFVFSLLGAYSVLFIYSVLKGNQTEDILFFFKPLLIFLLLPSLLYLFRNYSPLRYLKSFVISVFLLILLFSIVLAIAYFIPELAFTLNNSQELITVLFYPLLPRVIIKTFVFLVPAFIYVCYYCDGRRKYILMFFCFVAAVISQTYAIVFAVILFVLFHLILHKKYISVFFILSFLIGSYLFSMGSDVFNNSKQKSVDIKRQQVDNILKDMDVSELFLGKGIGAYMVNMDERRVSEIVIEVAPVMLFRIGGILLSVNILLAYFFPLLIGGYLAIVKHDRLLTVLVLSQLSVLICSLSNPYIWSGGMGLFFITIIVAYIGYTFYNHA